MKIDKYYICHYSKLEERRKYIEKHLESCNFKVEWVLEYDKEMIDMNELKKKFPLITENTKFNRKLSMSEISLILKHFHIINEVVINEYSNVVVFEDDIVLVEGFDEKLQVYANQLPTNYEILWLGTCCNLHINEVKEGVNVYSCNRGSRCTHCYLISYQACKKIVNYFNTVNEPIDWFFNKVIIDLKLENYWAEPELSVQNPLFDSSINCGLVN
jgi:GR25 family glycosyltransferase involved in LPS biosynthesis